MNKLTYLSPEWFKDWRTGQIYSYMLFCHCYEGQCSASSRLWKCHVADLPVMAEKTMVPPVVKVTDKPSVPATSSVTATDSQYRVIHSNLSNSSALLMSAFPFCLGGALLCMRYTWLWHPMSTSPKVGLCWSRIIMTLWSLGLIRMAKE